MRRHRTDYLSLVPGIAFVATGVLYLAGGFTWGFQLRWVAAILLLALGVGALLGSREPAVEADHAGMNYGRGGKEPIDAIERDGSMAERDPIKRGDHPPPEDAERYERAVREGEEDAPPPDEPHAVGREGTTAAEQRRGEPPRERDRQLSDTETEPEAAPAPTEDRPRVGRPVEDKGGAHAVDTEDQTLARESGDRDDLAAAEEAAMQPDSGRGPTPTEETSEEIADPASETREH